LSEIRTRNFRSILSEPHPQQSSSRGFDDRFAFDAWVVTRPNEREVFDAIERDADEQVLEVSVEASASIGQIVQLAAETVGIPVAQLCSRRRTQSEVLGRFVTVACAARVGIPGTHIAGALGMSQQAVSVIHRRGVDAAVERLVSHVLERLGDRRVIHTSGGSSV
jgi:hypothetical protein